jgi:hypothetical protein
MREYRPGKPLVFSHIPKCAGTSLGTALAQALQPERQVYAVDLSLIGGYTDFDDLRGAARESFIFSPEELPAEADFVSGHIAPATTRARYPGADHITTLRHPSLRVISQWAHSRSLSDFDLRHFGSRGSSAFRVGRKPLADYLGHHKIAPSVDNTLTRFFAWPHPALERTEFIDERHDDDLLAAALESLDGFGYVGLVEDTQFMDRLGQWLGREVVETKLNERVSMPRSRRPDLAVELDQKTVDVLRHRSRLDEQLWKHVARQTLPDIDPDALLSATWDKALERYAKALAAPGDFRPLRRTVETLYGWGSALRRRVDPRIKV